MPTSLVTGGAGFLGSHLCEELLRRGHRVICIDNLETGSLAAGIDLENRDQLLVRMTTQNLQEAITARKQKRIPRYED